MANAKKKGTRTPAKSGASAPGNNNGNPGVSTTQTPANSNTGAPSRSAASPERQHQAQSNSQHPMLQARPKRNAERKFFDDMEDERPQHLSTRGKKKRGETYSSEVLLAKSHLISVRSRSVYVCCNCPCDYVWAGRQLRMASTRAA